MRNTVKDRLKFSTKRFRVFKALVGEEVIAARTVEAARNVSRFRIVVFDFARIAVVSARVDERVVAKLQIAFHEVVVKDALQRHGGAIGAGFPFGFFDLKSKTCCLPGTKSAVQDAYVGKTDPAQRKPETGGKVAFSVVVDDDG